MLLRTLGALELHDSDFTRPKPLLLLAYLALEGPRPRRFLAELFWPGVERRMKNLAVALSRLRRGVPGVIEADRRRVWARVTTDAERLLAALERGDVAAAMDLYEHPFLDGVEVSAIGTELEEWVFGTRELLAGRLRRASLAGSEQAARQGDFGAARAHAEAAHGLRGAGVWAPEDLLRLYTLLRASGSTAADEVGAEAATFDLDLATTEREARDRLLGAAEPSEEPSTARDSRFEARRLEQRIGFVTSSDGARIAYATIGRGPPLVKAANWLSHLDHDWDSPVWRHWLDALSRERTLVRYDERGCGLSDRDVELSLDAFVHDLEALVDTMGLERFPLLGMSQGAAASIAYAVRHPERVTHLILVGAHIEPEPEDEANALLEMIRIGWGRDNAAFRQAFTTLFMPEATPDQMRWFNDMQRTSASPEQAAELARTIFRTDDLPDRRSSARAARAGADADRPRPRRRGGAVRRLSAPRGEHPRRALPAARERQPRPRRDRIRLAPVRRGGGAVPRSGGRRPVGRHVRAGATARAVTPPNADAAWCPPHRSRSSRPFRFTMFA